jgi:hypothetical protein
MLSIEYHFRYASFSGTSKQASLLITKTAHFDGRIKRAFYHRLHKQLHTNFLAIAIQS